MFDPFCKFAGLVIGYFASMTSIWKFLDTPAIHPPGQRFALDLHYELGE
jgi:hypothetical protein